MQDISNLNSLTFLRFIAALVVVFHYALPLEPLASKTWLHGLLQGANAVSFFFVLSGFVLTIVYAPQSTSGGNLARHFYQARLARVYPVYCLSGLATILVLGNFNFKDGLLYFSLAQSLVPNSATAINAPAWSLSVEVIFYAVMPFVLQVAAKMSLWKIVVATSLFWMFSTAFWSGVSAHLQPTWPSAARAFINYCPLWHLNQFFVGIAAGMITLRLRPTQPVVAAAGIAISAYALIYLQVRHPSAVYAVGGIAPLYALFIVCLYWDRSALTKLLSHRYLRFLGEMSYAIYLLQIPVMTISLSSFAELGLSPPLATLLGIGVLLLTSAFVYQWVERPLRTVLRGR
jgi:peptidoglycan/LPS O-acetylase OafA/YrhL